MDAPTVDRSALEGKVLPELQKIAEALGIEGHQKLRKAELIEAIVTNSSGDGGAPAAVAEAGEAEGGEQAAGNGEAGAGPRTRPRRGEEGEREEREEREGTEAAHQNTHEIWIPKRI